MLIRPWDCWCAACLQIVGRGVGNMAGRDCEMLKPRRRVSSRSLRSRDASELAAASRIPSTSAK